MRGNGATLPLERRTEVTAVSSRTARTVAMGGEGGAKPSIKRLFSRMDHIGHRTLISGLVKL